jgi:Tfp pilus assembly protein PilN
MINNRQEIFLSKSELLQQAESIRQKTVQELLQELNTIPDRLLKFANQENLAGVLNHLNSDMANQIGNVEDLENKKKRVTQVLKNITGVAW